jgi:CheY-like chemotaxis protein
MTPVRERTYNWMTPENSKPRVLIVDDERLIADTLVIILNQNGFEATAAYSGEQAVELALGLKPAMLLSDVIMDRMNGIEAAIQITKDNPACKVLLFSGQPAVAEMIETAARNGYQFSILAKPVHPAAILKELEELTH